ncbi:hypothetical protein GCM10025779_31320 [Arthrobacter cryoconiti]
MKGAELPVAAPTALRHVVTPERPGRLFPVAMAVPSLWSPMECQPPTNGKAQRSANNAKILS